MEDCIFCKIARGEIPSVRLYEDDKLLAFRDIEPQAPTHILIIPKCHVKDVLEYAAGGGVQMDEMTRLAARLAREEGVAQTGFRLVMNCGPDAGQTVGHMHLHLLGGRSMSARMA